LRCNCDTKELGALCDLAEQRGNQSEFSFELEELSSKFARIDKPEKKD
jgi:hypothetical protein